MEILQCLKKYGQRLDLEIAKEMNMPLATVRQGLAGLAATEAIITCSLTRFEKGKRIDAWQCRVSGYVPPLAPGRKAKPTTSADGPGSSRAPRKAAHVVSRHRFSGAGPRAATVANRRPLCATRSPATAAARPAAQRVDSTA